MCGRTFDLEKRAFIFAKNIRRLSRKIELSITNRADLHQLAKSSGSVGANYLEANNALSRKDFLLRIRICLKEAKESGFWLRLLDLRSNNSDLLRDRDHLLQETNELVKLFAAIIQNSTHSKS